MIATAFILSQGITATSTPKKVNVRKFYGHQRRNNHFHPVENCNDSGHLTASYSDRAGCLEIGAPAFSVPVRADHSDDLINGDHLAASHSGCARCLDIGAPVISVPVRADHCDELINGDHLSMDQIYRKAVECPSGAVNANSSNPQGGFCFSTPTGYPQQFIDFIPSTDPGGFCFSTPTGYTQQFTGCTPSINQNGFCDSVPTGLRIIF